MIDTVAVATDGSESVSRCVDVAADLAARFDAAVHALYVVDEREVSAAPEQLRDELREAHQSEAGPALKRVVDAALERSAAETTEDVTTAVESGRPADAICEYARREDVDVVATGTRGRHGEHRLLLGSVAERVARQCPAPVLTVRQLDEAT